MHHIFIFIFKKNASPPVDYRVVLGQHSSSGYLFIEIRTKTSVKYIASDKDGKLFLESNRNNRRAWFNLSCV